VRSNVSIYLSLNFSLKIDFSPSPFCFGLLTLIYKRITRHEISVAKPYSLVLLQVALVCRILKIICKLNITPDALGNHPRRTLSCFVCVGGVWVGPESVHVIGSPSLQLYICELLILLSQSSRPSHLLLWHSWFSAPPILLRHDGSCHCLPFFRGHLLQRCLAVT
jgi:hypothetical protein